MKKGEAIMRRVALFLAGVLLAATVASCGGDTKEVTKEVPAPTVGVQGDVAIEVGKTATFTATTDDGTDTEYEWSTSDANVATVGADGVVTGVAAGTAIITATGKETGASGTWGVHVYAAAVEPEKVARVFVSGPALVEVGQAITLEAETVDGEDTGYTWETSEAGIATVDEKGEVTGVAEGSVTITAAGKETGEKGSWNIYVFETDEPPLPEPKVAISGPSAVKIGETITLEATTTDGEDSGYDWASSDEAIATVADGVVTGVTEGAVVITATGKDTGASDGYNVYVFVIVPPTPEVAVSGPSAVKVGETITLEATTTDGEDSGYDWASSDEAIATVADGVVTGVTEGAVVITATGKDTGASDGYNVYVFVVVPPPAPEVKISGPAAVKLGETIDLEAATVYGEDTGYDWNSSNDAVATVNADGTVTGIAIGPAIITATGKDSGATADWNVYVWDEIPPPDPVVTVAGPLSAIEGETKQFVATTFNGNDNGYDWKSDNEAVATVDATGIVTAVAPGTAIISATGKDSLAAGQQGIVVMDFVPEVPFEQLWEGSGHADFGAVAFTYWDKSNPPAIPTNCARCHSTPGYLDYLGVDGSAVGTVDKTAPIGTVVSCTACHNSATTALTEVTFPSGVKVTGLGDEARCMVCHQGRESTVSVDKAIADNVSYTDADSKGDGKLGFKNIHYFAAGATLFGGEVKGGYQYEGKHYDKKFPHATGYDRCNTCHEPHTLQLKTAECVKCHAGATDLAGIEAIRMTGSGVDFDGDGDVEEGLREELETMGDKLYAAIQLYAKDVAGTPIVYYAGAHPYFFKDTNANGTPDPDETVSANSYKAWTPRLLKAAFNYQFSHKDPGAFAHNGKYIVQLLYDSMADLGTKVTVNMTGMHRTGEGHFDSDSYAFRRWDKDNAVSSSCARCHTPTGFELYAQYGVDTLVSQPPSDGLNCMTCHTDVDYATGAPRKYIAQVTFPSTKVIKNDPANPDDSFLCAGCHMGRESKTTIDTLVASGAALSFKNIHYAPAASLLYGKDAGVLYEYTGKTYAAKFAHFSPESARCAYCHNLAGEDHKFKPELTASCKMCHTEAAGDLAKIRKNRTLDYDGDGNNTEKLSDEIATLGEALYKQLQAVATASGKPLAYDENAHPYFYSDKNGNGVVDADELGSANSYKGWTAPMLRAAHNFQAWHKEKGAWAHNTDYMVQVLIDSIADLGGDVSTFKRP
jgi:uncharacterized protein YjdB